METQRLYLSEKDTDRGRLQSQTELERQSEIDRGRQLDRERDKEKREIPRET